MHRHLAFGLFALVASACSAESDQGGALEGEGVGDIAEAIGNGSQHFVYASSTSNPSTLTAQGFAHCPPYEFLKGVDPADGKRLICEPHSGVGNSLDSGYSDTIVNRGANGTAACSAYSVAVGWKASTGAILCHVVTPGPMGGTAPLGAATTTSSQLGLDAHKVTYFSWWNGTFNDEMPVCLSGRGITELTTKLITYGTAPNTFQANTFFYTCGW